jgi:hypothetical protein
MDIRINPAIVREKIVNNNRSRRETFSMLYEGCRDGDDAKVGKAVLRLGIYARLPQEVGFSIHDCYHYLEPIGNQLNGVDDHRGLREILTYKKLQLQRHNLKLSTSGGAGNDNKAKIYRDKLLEDIHGLIEKVRFLSRIEAIMLDQLRKRGEEVRVMESELIPESTIVAIRNVIRIMK